MELKDGAIIRTTDMDTAIELRQACNAASVKSGYVSSFSRQTIEFCPGKAVSKVLCKLVVRISLEFAWITHETGVYIDIFTNLVVDHCTSLYTRCFSDSFVPVR